MAKIVERGLIGGRRPHAPLDLEVWFGTAAELVLVAVALTHDDADELEAGSGWAHTRRAALPPDAAEAMGTPLLSLFGTWTALLPLMTRLRSGASAADAIALVASHPAVDLWSRVARGLLWELDAGGDDLAGAAASGDRRARAEFAALPAEQERVALARDQLLATSPARLRTLMRRTLAGIGETASDDLSEERSAMLRDSAGIVIADAAANPPSAVIERATGGVTIPPGSERRRIVLVPGLAMRPWNTSGEDDETLVICYRVPAEHLDVDPAAPPAALVRLTRALGDERRLRLLRLLAAGPSPLGPLAERLDLAKSTVHHHLVLLRDAGLVTVRLVDREYEYRSGALAALAPLLAGYIEGERS